MQTVIHTYIVDAFTDEPFKGNPAGVCLLGEVLEKEQMLSIAGELGYSETAFLSETESSGKYRIRFFSPKMEIPLCGHATLAASKVLFEINPGLINIQFITIQNIDLFIKKEEEAIVMEFPIYETIPVSVPMGILKAMGIDKILNSEYNQETNILLLELEDSQILKELQPDFEALKRSHDSINGVLVTAPSKKNNYDFESRYFWPWSGTNEDPVTGGTHTFLAKYWSKKLGKRKMKSYQCSKRTGFMEVELLSDKKMTIKSLAQIVFEGKLRL